MHFLQFMHLWLRSIVIRRRDFGGITLAGSACVGIVAAFLKAIQLWDTYYLCWRGVALCSSDAAMRTLFFGIITGGIATLAIIGSVLGWAGERFLWGTDPSYRRMNIAMVIMAAAVVVLTGALLAV